MKRSNNYLDLNKEAWNQKTLHHIQSDFYDQASFKAGRNSLNEIELNLLGDVSNKKILHLQCHFGQDSISLARMGALVTGVDLSDEAIKEGKLLSEELNVPVTFVNTDVYSADEEVDANSFDLVFSTYGTITWLPDLIKWAQIISKVLKPGGELLLVEFHPFIWTFDDNMEKIAYHYFNQEEIREITVGTYTDRNADLRTETVAWNHSLDEVIGALLANGFEIIHFKEYDYSPYPCFSNVKEIAPGKFQFNHIDKRIPMVYSLKASRKVD